MCFWKSKELLGQKAIIQIFGQNYRIGKIRQARLVSGTAPFAEPEFALYDLLLKEGENSYGRYKALTPTNSFPSAKRSRILPRHKFAISPFFPKAS
jgi:hypothetical protein